MSLNICIHGHFYQPPRENPSTGEIPIQPSAKPFRNWNERILAECYKPMTEAKVIDQEKDLVTFINNFKYVSFDAGPTLMRWMAEAFPEVHQRILDADKESIERNNGHGNAMAQSYHHTILPLDNERDQKTEIYWGLKDFEHRFGRKSEGIWLPECGVTTNTLNLLVEAGIKFVVLSPYQMKAFRYGSEGDWTSAENGFDCRYPYRVKTSETNEITVFFYDGNLSQKAAFGPLLDNGNYFLRSMVAGLNGHDDNPQLLNIAIDGETFGHHHKFGEMALAFLVYLIRDQQRVNLTNYANFLEKHPPVHEALVIDESAWSCAHGLGRWQDDCGCWGGRGKNWHQKWRKPLREALRYLRDHIDSFYEKACDKIFKDVWDARKNYIEIILDSSDENIERFLKTHLADELLGNRKTERLIDFLEMQRFRLMMFTSCGWFFDEVSDIETVQIMKYASRALSLAEKLDPERNSDLRENFLKKLELAPSNKEEFVHARNVFEKIVEEEV